MTLQEAAELDQKINELKRQTDPGIAAQFRDDVNLFAMYLSRQTVAEQAMEIIDELQKELEERKAYITAWIQRCEKLEEIVQIQEKAIRDAIYCEKYYEHPDPKVGIRVAVSDLENALRKVAALRNN